MMGGLSERVVLVLARDVVLISALRRMLAREGFAVRTGRSVGDGTGARWPGEDVSAVLVDAGLLADDPAAGLTRLRSGFSGALLLVMAGRPEHQVLVAAVQEGARPLTADFDLAELVTILRDDDDGTSGVREPRRPRPPVGSTSAALQPPAP